MRVRTHMDMIDFTSKSENYKGETYIARDSVIEELMLEKS